MEKVTMANNIATNPAIFARLPTSSPPSSSSSLGFRSRPRLGFPVREARSMKRNNSNSLSSLRVSASVAAAAEKPSTVPDIVLQPIREISGTVKLPGSKSLSNRILLLAALSQAIGYLQYGTYGGDVGAFGDQSLIY